jgi:hypothetical protein
MASYPTSVVSLSNPSGGANLNSPSHATQHGNANDEIEAIETVVGISPNVIADTVTATSTPATVAAALDMLANMLKRATGAANWYTAATKTLADLWALFHATTGHKHTGGAGDAPILTQINGNNFAATLPTNKQVATWNTSGTQYEPQDVIEDIILEFTNAGAVLTTGVKKDFALDYDALLMQVTLLADQSGSIVFDLWKDTYANYPPTVADTITASAKPTLSTALKSKDSTLTGWTKQITAGDTVRVNIDSVATVTRVTMILKVKRN